MQDKKKVRHWTGKWIWDEGDGKEPNVYCYFRKEFSAMEGQKGWKIFITADTRYQLYVNGSFVGRGSLQSQPYFQYYDVRELDDYIRPGRNCIGIIVYHMGKIPDTRGGLLAELVDETGRVVTATDATWSVHKAEAWSSNTACFRMNKATPYQEHYDARLEPIGWMEPGFDESGWKKAKVLKGRISDCPPAVSPWTYLVERDIPFMNETIILPKEITYVEECVDLANRQRSEDLSICLSACGSPIKYSTLEGVENLLSDEGYTIVQNSTNHLDRVFDGIYDPCIVLDFGKVITAYIQLDLEGPAASIVDIGYAERLIDGRFNNSIEGWFADRYTLKEGRQIFQSFTWKGFRYVKLRFHSCFEKLKLHSVKAIVTSYPYEEKGQFHSSDNTLNKVFDISRYTIRLCSNEFITDTPWREQGQWLGDVSAVTLGGIYSCFGDTRLPGKFLRQSAANQLPTGLITNMTNTVSFDWNNVIPDYSLWWITALWNHYLYTGEEEWIHKYYPHVLKIIQAFLQYQDEYGMICNMPYWIFIDWADIDRRGECAPLNGIFYGVLGVVEKMAAFKRDEHTRNMINNVRTDIQLNFMERFYNKDKGCFVDANIDGQLSDKISEHTNAIAILYGLCPDHINKDIIFRFYEEPDISYTEAQPFFTTFVLQALDRAGRFDLAINIIKERWGKRMIEKGATSTYEEWGMNGSWRSGEYKGFMRTLSHAWSAHPAEFLIRNLIGLEIVDPGCKKIRLSPRKVSFDYEVIFPTLQGIVEVIYKDSQLHVKIPEGVNLENTSCKSAFGDKMAKCYKRKH